MDNQERRLSVVIADDDILVQNLIISYISSFSTQVKIVGKASSGEEVIELVRMTNPSAVFLDVGMPGLDGISVAAWIKREYPGTFIIFVTAHAQYAAEAYQMEAVDYLIKPISREAVHRAIRKIERFLKLSANEINNHKPLIFKYGHEIYFLNPKFILFFEKKDRKTIIHTPNGIYHTNETLNSLEKRIPDTFFRCHKSFIINTAKIERISPLAERIYEINFDGYEQAATMGRKKLEELLEKLG